MNSSMVGLQRILVAVSEESQQAAMQAAKQLARECGVPLAGMFVEDINLVRSAQLGCVREIGLSFARAEHTLENLERKLRAKATLIQRVFQRMAGMEQAVVFSISRGIVEEEILKAQQAMDLLLLSCPARPGRRAPTGGATTRAILERAAGPVLLLPEKGMLGGELFAILDDTEASSRVVGQARNYARLLNRKLVILDVREPETRSATEPGRENEETIHLSGWQTLYRFLVQHPRNLLVLPRHYAGAQADGLMRLLQGIGMPLLYIERVSGESA